MLQREFALGLALAMVLLGAAPAFAAQSPEW